MAVGGRSWARGRLPGVCAASLGSGSHVWASAFHGHGAFPGWPTPWKALHERGQCLGNQASPRATWLTQRGRGPTPGHTAGEWPSWDSNPGRAAPGRAPAARAAGQERSSPPGAEGPVGPVLQGVLRLHGPRLTGEGSRRGTEVPCCPNRLFLPRGWGRVGGSVRSGINSFPVTKMTTTGLGALPASGVAPLCVRPPWRFPQHCHMDGSPKPPSAPSASSQARNTFCQVGRSVSGSVVGRLPPRTCLGHRWGEGHCGGWAADVPASRAVT